MQRVVRGAYSWKFGSIASLPTETTDGEILVAFLAQTWPQKRSQIKNFPGGGGGGGGGMPPDPPTLFTLTHTQWPYQFDLGLGWSLHSSPHGGLHSMHAQLQLRH